MRRIVAKKMLLVQSQAYRAQYGFNAIFLLPTNLYGPGDNFDLEASHVIPALIRKCLDAKRQRVGSVTAWGTGTATRDFLYVDDAAEGIVRAAEAYDEPEPMNLGGQGCEISVRKLARAICRATGFLRARSCKTPPGRTGQPRRAVDGRGRARHSGSSRESTSRKACGGRSPGTRTMHLAS